jgi:uncharacterized phiE125 gp8 family phage protein
VHLAPYDLVRTVVPTERPVSVDELRAHLALETPEYDTRLGDLLDAALGRFDGPAGVLGRVLVTQTWKLYFDTAFPCYRIGLPLPPLQTVSSIQYVDNDGVTQTVSSSDYQVLDGNTAAIVPAYGKAWPATRVQPRAVIITFVAGFGAASAVPAPLKAALKMLAGFLFNNTGDFAGADALPPAVSALIAPYRMRSFL